MTQMRLWDNHVVDTFYARMGAWQVEDEDIEEYKGDAVVIGVFVAMVDGAAIKRAKDGGWARTSVLKPSLIRVVKGDMRTELIDVFDLDVSEQLTLPTLVSSQAAVGSPPASTQAAPPDPNDEFDDEEDDEEIDDPDPGSPGQYAGPPPTPQVDLGTGEIIGAPAHQHDPALAAFLSEGP